MICYLELHRWHKLREFSNFNFKLSKNEFYNYSKHTSEACKIIADMPSKAVV